MDYKFRKYAEHFQNRTFGNTNKNSVTQLDASITENEISNPPSLQFKTTRTDGFA